MHGSEASAFTLSRQLGVSRKTRPSGGGRSPFREVGGWWGSPSLLTYLNHTHARVQENASFGLFRDFLILVEVQIVGAVAQLGEVEVPPLEGLGVNKNKQTNTRLSVD